MVFKTLKHARRVHKQGARAVASIPTPRDDATIPAARDDATMEPKPPNNAVRVEMLLSEAQMKDIATTVLVRQVGENHDAYDERIAAFAKKGVAKQPLALLQIDGYRSVAAIKGFFNAANELLLEHDEKVIACEIIQRVWCHLDMNARCKL